MYVISNTDYFDIKAGDVVTVVETVKAHKDTSKDGLGADQKLDIVKVTLPGKNKVHYLYSMEVEELPTITLKGADALAFVNALED